MNDQSGHHESETEEGQDRPSNEDAESEFERYPLDEWDALRERVEELDATTTATADEITIGEEDARFVVTGTGTVSGSMPRHEFARSDLDAVEVATDGSALRVYDADDGLEYVFEL